MNDRLAWGILGTGNIARQFATGVNASKRGRLVAVGSRDAAKAATFAAAHRIPTACGSYEELIRRPDADAVYNSLPNSLHHEWTIRALRAGKHVLCEKPFASNLAQAQEMFDVAKASGKLAVEAFMYRSHPQTRAALMFIAGGEIGEVKLIRASFCFRTSRIAGNIRFDPALAGGAVMDVGCYCVSF